MEKKFLLGVMGNQIVVGNFEIRDWNGYDEFSASFDLGEAFDINLSQEEIENYWNDYWDYLDSDTKLDILDDGESTKQVWLDEKVDETYYTDIRDCSCTDLEMDFNGVTINFETISCGQYDCRKDEAFKDMKFTNKEAFDKLMDLWDNYHLREVNEDIKRELGEIEDLLSPYDWYGGDEVVDFIEQNLEF